jgi:formylmethanofuran dehydrogenase subunit E
MLKNSFFSLLGLLLFVSPSSADEGRPPSRCPSPPDLKALGSFHGHEGPFLVFGARAAEIGLREIQVPGWQMNVLLETKLDGPHRCLLDALQLCSGATMGRGKIQILSAPSTRIWFIDSKTGASVTLTLNDKARELIGRLPKFHGPATDSDKKVAELAQEALRLKPEEIWKWQRNPPP